MWIIAELRSAIGWDGASCAIRPREKTIGGANELGGLGHSIKFDLCCGQSRLKCSLGHRLVSILRQRWLCLSFVIIRQCRTQWLLKTQGFGDEKTSGHQENR